MRALFDIAEMLGEPDPFSLANKMTRKIFIWWKQRNALKLTELFEKWEYYAAAIRSDIWGASGVEPPNIDDMLIKLELRTPEEAAKADAERDEMFMAAIAALDKKLNRKGG